MSKRLLIRVGVLAAATVFALSGCFIFIGDWDLSNWTADLKIVAEWDDDYGNLDLHLSYPFPTDSTTDNATTNNTAVPFYADPYEDRADVGANGDDGFFLEDGSANRQLVYSSSDPATKKSTYKPSSSSPAAIELTVDDTSDGEEVIVVRRPPFEYNGSTLSYPNAADAQIGLPTSRDQYAWVGVSELYVNASGGNIAAADLQVTVYDANDNPLISFRPPEDTSYSSASIARIHLFIGDDNGTYSPYYLIVPDQRWIWEGTSGFRSVTGTTSDGETFVGAFGRAETE